EGDGVDARQHEGAGVSAPAAEAESATTETAAATTAAGAERVRRLILLTSAASAWVGRPAGTAGRIAAATCANRRRRWLHAKIPACRIDARLVRVGEDRAGNLPHLSPGGVADPEGDRLGRLLQQPHHH